MPLLRCVFGTICPRLPSFASYFRHVLSIAGDGFSPFTTDGGHVVSVARDFLSAFASGIGVTCRIPMPASPGMTFALVAMDLIFFFARVGKTRLFLSSCHISTPRWLYAKPSFFAWTVASFDKFREFRRADEEWPRINANERK
jgi:hypothetical protein